MAEGNKTVVSSDDDVDSTTKLLEDVTFEKKIKVDYRENPSYLPFNDYFMSLCLLTAARSKDPVTKVGACIVNKDNRVLSMGYNGMPSGVNDYDLPWDKHAKNIYDTKYPYVCHAEMNAIMNMRLQLFDLRECCLYTSKFPCPECAKLIIQSGLRSVIYADYKAEPYEVEYTTMRMFELAGVNCKKHTPSVKQITINVVGEQPGAQVQKLKNSLPNNLSSQ